MSPTPIYDSKSSDPIPESIVQQAIVFRIQLESKGHQASDLIACQQWRNSHPHHEQAWQRLEKMENTFQQATQQSPHMTRSVLAQTDCDMKHISRRQALRRIGGSTFAVTAFALLAHNQGLIQQLKADYVTHGAPQQYTLQDNSEVWLNTHSAIELDFNESKRTMHLTRGEMRIFGAPDARPLQVSTAQAELSTHGSRLFLRNDGDHSLLQVIEGTVLMQPHGKSHTLKAQAGDVYRISAQRLEALTAQVFDYSSWVDGVFSVRNMPLRHFLSELSRYRTGFLRCDPSLETRRISGVFQLKDTDLILQILARSVQARVHYRTPWWAEIRPSQIT